jgi:hypothetical protein
VHRFSFPRWRTAIALWGHARCASLALVVVAGCVIETPDELLAERPRPSALSISPQAATVEAGGAQQFAAAVIGNGIVPQGVRWSVRPGAPSGPVGSIDASGLYRVTAPLVSQPGSVATDARDYVVATSLADSSLVAEVAVDVPAVSITISPTSAELMLGDSLAFSATLRGLSSKAVEWSCTYGTIDANGVYAAPRLALNGRDTILVRPAGGAVSQALRDTFAFTSMVLKLRPPVLTGASGPVRPLDTLIIFGSGFLPAAAGMSRQVEFETTSGNFGGLPALTVEENAFGAQVPAGGPWSGRLRLLMWGGGATDPFALVESNLLDAGLPP